MHLKNIPLKYNMNGTEINLEKLNLETFLFLFDLYDEDIKVWIDPMIYKYLEIKNKFNLFEKENYKNYGFTLIKDWKKHIEKLNENLFRNHNQELIWLENKENNYRNIIIILEKWDLYKDRILNETTTKLFLRKNVENEDTEITHEFFISIIFS